MAKITEFKEPTFKAVSGESPVVARYDLLGPNQTTPALTNMTLKLNNQNPGGTPINATSINTIVTAVNKHMDEQASASVLGHVKASTMVPKENGTANVGTETSTFARGDHVHPYTHPNSGVTAGTYNRVTVNAQGHVTAGTNEPTIPGNIETATRLQMARTINGTLFDGSSNITFGRYFASAIQANEDLNNYTNEGFYYCPANATAATLANCPTTLAFSLQVTRHAGVHQRLVQYMATGNPRIYFRNYYNGTWMAWAREYTTLDLPKPAEIGAVPDAGGTLTGPLQLPHRNDALISASGAGVTFDGWLNARFKSTANTGNQWTVFASDNSTRLLDVFNNPARAISSVQTNGYNIASAQNIRTGVPSVSIPTLAAGERTSINVSFGFEFSSVPRVLVTPNTTSTGLQYQFGTASATTTGFTLSVRNLTSASITAWTASIVYFASCI